MLSLEELNSLDGVSYFEENISDEDVKKTEKILQTLQVNIGKKCNLACKHCHVQAGPNRGELMSKDIMKDCLVVFKEQGFSILDITGGAPEMNLELMWFIEEATKIAKKVIIRTNLTILKEEGYKHLPEFYAKHKVELVCSLPYYTAKDTNRQRGEGVFEDCIDVLQKLNEIGYGRNPELILNMVYNPGGAFLPAPQASLEEQYKIKLKNQFDIDFNQLFTITNNPIGRFGGFLKRSNNLERYMDRLCSAFNPSALKGMMCRTQLSVSWDGSLYDCDFNQAVDLKVEGENSISMLKGKELSQRKIKFGNHCYACTAGAGSSCGGTTA